MSLRQHTIVLIVLSRDLERENMGLDGYSVILPNCAEFPVLVVDSLYCIGNVSATQYANPDQY